MNQKVKKDIVIPYIQSGDGGEELKASLATLHRIKDWSGIVWIVGESEDWFPENPDAIIRYIQCPSVDDKFRNIQMALLAACHNPEVSEDFYYSNDDIYIHDEFYSIPPMYRESLDEHAEKSNNSYSQSLIATKRLLKRSISINPILNYETHTPMPVTKTRLKATLEKIKQVQDSGYMTLQLRTYYGNVWYIGGEYYDDGKHKEGLAITSS